MAHIFISYVREAQEAVNRLCDELRSRGFDAWLDRDSILPGQRWRQAIRSAISDGAFFIACFSQEYNRRSKSYMNEELALAIDELRKRSTNQAWFIPVLLSNCLPPDRSIGGGETLRDIQWVALHESWSLGIEKIVRCIESCGSIDLQMQELDSGTAEKRQASSAASDASISQASPAKEEGELRLIAQAAARMAVAVKQVEEVAEKLGQEVSDTQTTYQREAVEDAFSFKLDAVAPELREGLESFEECMRKFSPSIDLLISQVIRGEHRELSVRQVKESFNPFFRVVLSAATEAASVDLMIAGIPVSSLLMQDAIWDVHLPVKVYVEAARAVENWTSQLAED